MPANNRYNLQPKECLIDIALSLLPLCYCDLMEITVINLKGPSLNVSKICQCKSDRTREQKFMVNVIYGTFGRDVFLTMRMLIN